MNIELITATASRCREIEDNFNKELKALQEQVKTELTPMIGKTVKVTYFTTDSYAIKYGHSIQEFVGVLKGFSRNGFLHVVDHDIYRNIRPMRIINIVLY